MIVVAPESDGPGGRKTSAHQLHDARRLLDVRILEVRRRENRSATPCPGDQGILGRIERGRVAELLRGVSGPNISTAHLALESLVLRCIVGDEVHASAAVRRAENGSVKGNSGPRRSVECHGTSRDGGLGLIHIDGQWISLGPSGANESDVVTRHRDSRRLEQRVRHVSGGVASGDARLVADEVEKRALGSGRRNAIHRVVGVLAGVILRHGTDHRPVGAGGRCRRGGLGLHTAQDRAVRMPQQAESAVGKPGRRRHHVARHTHLAVARRGEEVGLAAFLTDDHFGPDQVRPTGKVEANHRKLAGRVLQAAFLDQTVDESQRPRITRLQRRCQPGRSDDHRRSTCQSRPEQLATGDGTPVVLVQQRLARSFGPREFFGDEEHGYSLLMPITAIPWLRCPGRQCMPRSSLWKQLGRD